MTIIRQHRHRRRPSATFRKPKTEDEWRHVLRVYLLCSRAGKPMEAMAPRLNYPTPQQLKATVAELKRRLKGVGVELPPLGKVVDVRWAHLAKEFSRRMFRVTRARESSARKNGLVPKKRRGKTEGDESPGDATPQGA